MIFKRYGTFSGGIDLADEKYSTLNLPIQPGPLPATLRVPLGAPPAEATAIVQPGQTVAAGQKIAQGTPGFPSIYAPLAGKVLGETRVYVSTWGGLVPAAAIELGQLSGTWDLKLPEPRHDWQKLDERRLRDQIEHGDLWVHRSAPEPLGGWIARAQAKKCSTLIANVMEDQPYVCCDHHLLAEYGAQVVTGLAILARVISARHVILAVDQRRTDLYRRVLGATKQYRVSPMALPRKYPIGADPLLVKVLTRREMPLGGSTMDVGAAVVNASTCLALYAWMACEQRALGRVVTVGGERAGRTGNFYVPFGMPCDELIQASGPIIHGGPMVGWPAPPDSVVSFGTNALLAIDTPTIHAPTPCMRCGWCTDHCPARLNVALLNDDYELGLTDHARRLGVQACMGCGVCSYICPAGLPLAQRVKQLKRITFRDAAPAVGAVETRGTLP